ncbi:hypothetical protein [Thiothrix eikelboomii]|uniref:hypothetical protein n=1 Tax=Thiothrix eikelboomii TaxID=92487 RepID=UPI003BB151EA
MRNYYILFSASVLSMTLLSGCMYNTSKESSLPTPTASVTPSQTQTTPLAKTSKPKVVVNNTANSSEAVKAKQAMVRAKPKSAAPSVKTIKSEPALKAGKKLSPEEVEDLIRKLSVCRPS